MFAQQQNFQIQMTQLQRKLEESLKEKSQYEEDSHRYLQNEKRFHNQIEIANQFNNQLIQLKKIKVKNIPLFKFILS